MSDRDSTRSIKVVSTVSDPPKFSSSDIARIERESQQLSDAFRVRTAGMESLTADDLKIRIK